MNTHSVCLLKPKQSKTSR